MKDGMQRGKEVGFVKIRLEIEGFFAARMERNEKNSSGGKGENTRNEADQWGVKRRAEIQSQWDLIFSLFVYTKKKKIIGIKITKNSKDSHRFASRKFFCSFKFWTVTDQNAQKSNSLWYGISSKIYLITEANIFKMFNIEILESIDPDSSLVVIKAFETSRLVQDLHLRRGRSRSIHHVVALKLFAGTQGLGNTLVKSNMSTEQSTCIFAGRRDVSELWKHINWGRSGSSGGLKAPQAKSRDGLTFKVSVDRSGDIYTLICAFEFCRGHNW